MAGAHPGAHGTGSMSGGGRTGRPTRPRTHYSHSLQPADKEDLSERGHSSVQNRGGGDLGQAQPPFLQPPWETLAPEGRLSACSPVTLDPARNQSKTWGREFAGQNFCRPSTVPGCTGLFRNCVQPFFILFFLIILFTYLFLAVLGLGSCTGFSRVAVCGLLIGVASLVTEHGLWGDWPSVFAARGLSSCSSLSLEHRLSSCDSWAYLVAPCCVESSQTRDPTGVSCIGRQILYH